MNQETRILMLEDVPTDAELIERELRANGLAFNAKRVDTKEAFAEALVEFAPDLILSDYNLPQFSGLEALRLLKERALDIPFILVTGSLTEEIAVLCMKEGAYDYILKGSLKRLSSAIEKALDQKEIEAQRHGAIAAMRQSEERFQLVAQATNDAIWDWNMATNGVWWNDCVHTLFGYTKAEVGPDRSWWRERVHPEDRNRIGAALHAFIETHAQFWSEEYRFRRADGSYATVIDRGSIVRDDQNQAMRMIGSMMDITERKRAEEQIHYLSYHDALTDLPNRAHFEDRVPQALSLAQRNQQMVAVVLLDLDRFKNINDTLGHAVGDGLLRAVADRLLGRMRGSDTVARFSGDGFALLLTQLSRSRDIAKIAERAKGDAIEIVENILNGLKKPFEIGGLELFVTASVGISVYPHDGSDAHSLVQNASVAMSRVKESGGGGCEFYSAEMNSKSLERLALESDLRRAVEREEFFLHYQPQVDAQSGEILAVEALIRWQHPTLGLIPPLDFIRVAETNGLIVPIGEWTLKKACAEVRSWKEEGLPPIRLSVNLSARQFEQTNLLRMIDRAVADTGFEPELLEFEITESAVMKDPEQAIDTMRRLKAKGIQVAIDDFGSGYSSLSYLKRFPIDRLKIDQSFVREATTNSTDAAIITAIVTLARNLGLKVIAEGVETPEQLTILRQLGCNEIQGYLFSRPLPTDELKDLILSETQTITIAQSALRLPAQLPLPEDRIGSV